MQAILRTKKKRGLRRVQAGLMATGLLADMRALVPYTLVAPEDPAWDSLAWKFDDFLLRPELKEERQDAFEHCVVHGMCLGDPHHWRTLASCHLYISHDFVYGARGSARILERAFHPKGLVLVTDRVILPETRRWPSSACP